MGQESLTIFRNTWSHSLHKGSTQPKIYSIHLILEYAIPGLWHRTPNFLRCSPASAFAADAVKATTVSFLSCPCLSMFVLVFCVVLVSSYRLCCLPFPSCSMFFMGGWCFLLLMGGCVCACVPLFIFLCFLPFGCLSFVLPSFLSLCGFSFLSEFVVLCLLSLTVCLWLLLWYLLLVFPSFVVVHNFFCLGFCHFVCVYDGVFWWVADFN